MIWPGIEAITDPGQAATRLREVADRMESSEYDPAALQEMLAPVNALLYEQSLPPCTCGQWQGPPWSRSWYCLRHHIGAGGMSTPPDMADTTSARAGEEM